MSTPARPAGAPSRGRIVWAIEDLSQRGGAEQQIAWVASMVRARARTELLITQVAQGSSHAQSPAWALASAGPWDAVHFAEGPRTLDPSRIGPTLRSLQRIRHVLADGPAPVLGVAVSWATMVRMALAATPGRARLLWACYHEPHMGHGWTRARRAALLRFLVARGVHLMSPSTPFADHMAGLGFPRDRMTVILPGIDADRFAAVAAARAPQHGAARAAIREGLGVASADLVVVVPARLDPVKNHGLLLEAVALARDRGVRIAVLCAGGTPPEQDAYAADLVARARALAIDDRVLWLGHRTDVPDLMVAADVCVLPSRSDTAGMALMEAGAAGLPTIACPEAGGPAEIVDDGRTGLLVDARDPRPCADALVRLARDPALCARLGTTARLEAERRFGLPRLERQWQALFDRLLGAALP